MRRRLGRLATCVLHALAMFAVVVTTSSDYVRAPACLICSYNFFQALRLACGKFMFWRAVRRERRLDEERARRHRAAEEMTREAHARRGGWETKPSDSEEKTK